MSIVLVGVKIETQKPHQRNTNTEKLVAQRQNFKMKPLFDREPEDYREKFLEKVQKVKV